MNYRHSPLFPLITLSILFSSCAFNRTLSYRQIDSGVEAPKAAVVIAFHDQREQVLSGKEKKTFCGHVNSSAQISYNVQTEDGLPLSTEFAQALSNSMSQKGGRASWMATEPGWKSDSIVGIFPKGNASRFLLFSINEWEASALPLFSTIRYEVRYDLSLKIFDEKGILIASSGTHGQKQKEEGMAVSMKKMQAYSQEILQVVVHELLSKEEVTHGLAMTSDH